MFKYYIYICTHETQRRRNKKLDTFTHLQRKEYTFVENDDTFLYDIIILKSYVIGVFQQTIYIHIYSMYVGTFAT